ncbi:MAG: CAP domain-containing protein [Myxococcota bacterium]|nr:CAP domain-containing protein [Myxococcota bacterium]
MSTFENALRLSYRLLIFSALCVLTLVAFNIVDRSEMVRSVAFFLGADPIRDFGQSPSPPNSMIDYELNEPLQSTYSQRPPIRKELAYAQLAEQHDYVYQAALGQAAREVAHFYQEHRRLAPTNALNFFLEAAGGTYWCVRQTVMITTDDGPQPIASLLARYHSPSTVKWHVGIGEHVVPGLVPVRILVALTAQETVTLEPMKRHYAPGEPFRIRGQLATTFHRPSILAMGPTGTIETIPITTNGPNFQAARVFEPGEWTVELLASGPAGPVPLTQMTFYVAQDAPTHFSGRWPPEIDASDDAGKYVLGLVNQARRAAGQAGLLYDAELSRIAVAHSKDMKTNGYVGHVSERTGTVQNRLTKAGYESTFFGENVALNGDLTDAHEGLLRSLGHRKNLLSSNYTHLGIGLAFSEEGWYVTQIFSRPKPTNLNRAVGPLAHTNRDNFHPVRAVFR